MFLINKDHNISNIELIYNKRYNFYKILYNLTYIKLIGISIKIKYIDLNINNYKYYILINDIKTLNLLNDIEKYIKNIIPNFKFLYEDKNNNKYIICKKYINDKYFKYINRNFLNIIIYKIKYNHTDDCYIPIINIV